jgi:hypothetical protein
VSKNRENDPYDYHIMTLTKERFSWFHDASCLAAFTGRGFASHHLDAM